MMLDPNAMLTKKPGNKEQTQMHCDLKDEKAENVNLHLTDSGVKFQWAAGWVADYGSVRSLALILRV